MHPKGVSFVRTWDHILTLGPIFLIEMMIFSVSMNVTCESFIKGFRLMFLPFKTNLIWVQTLMPRVLKLFFLLSQQATIWIRRPIFLNDFVKVVTIVSINREDS